MKYRCKKCDKIIDIFRYSSQLLSHIHEHELKEYFEEIEE